VRKSSLANPQTKPPGAGEKFQRIHGRPWQVECFAYSPQEFLNPFAYSMQIRQLAFPNDQESPTQAPQLPLRAQVSFPVGIQFTAPKRKA
jgi:hypothetical protein